jgi:hypothetical protein
MDAVARSRNKRQMENLTALNRPKMLGIDAGSVRLTLLPPRDGAQVMEGIISQKRHERRGVSINVGAKRKKGQPELADPDKPKSLAQVPISAYSRTFPLPLA